MSTMTAVAVVLVALVLVGGLCLGLYFDLRNRLDDLYAWLSQDRNGVKLVVLKAAEDIHRIDAHNKESHRVLSRLVQERLGVKPRDADLEPDRSDPRVGPKSLRGIPAARPGEDTEKTEPSASGGAPIVNGSPSDVTRRLPEEPEAVTVSDGGRRPPEIPMTSDIGAKRLRTPTRIAEPRPPAVPQDLHGRTVREDSRPPAPNRQRVPDDPPDDTDHLLQLTEAQVNDGGGVDLLDPEFDGHDWDNDTDGNGFDVSQFWQDRPGPNEDPDEDLKPTTPPPPPRRRHALEPPRLWREDES